MNIERPTSNVECEKMKKQTYAIGYTPQLLVKSLTVTYKLMYENPPSLRHQKALQ
jgi:hypothetical protein